MKILYTAILAVTLTACATNEFDAKIAVAEANILIEKEKAYARGIEAANQPKELFTLMGEIKCSDVQTKNGLCGVIVYNPNSKTTVPQRDKGFVDGVEAVFNGTAKLAGALMPLALAKEVTNIVGAVGSSAGGNTTNSDSYNQANVAKTAGADLADDGSTIDKSAVTTTTETADNSVVTNTDDNSTVTNTDDNSVVTNTDDNSTTTNTDDNSTATDDNSVVTTEPVVTP
jgi:hypothetical protein